MRLITENEMIKRHTGEETASCQWTWVCFFGGTNGDGCATSSRFISSHGGELWDLDSHKALLKAAGSEVLSYCSSSTDTFFSIPSVQLLANTLIITGSGNVHSRELLVMDSTQATISLSSNGQKK